MTYTLLIADRAYSSWSLRGWLPFAAFDIPVKTQVTRLYDDRFQQDLAGFAPARTVPVARAPEGLLLSDSLAIAWHLAEAFPDKGLLPADPALRTQAMNLITEMHAGFGHLRAACPMNLRTAWAGFESSDEVQADLARLDRIWGEALAASGGPWLCRTYSLADVFYAPVATRIATYGLTVTETCRTYVEAHLHEPNFRRWRAMGLVDGPDQSFYEMGLDRAPFPAPPALPAHAVDAGPSENAACPYSGGPVTDFLEIEGRVFGFCNPFCRDKTVADPEAWPEFMALLRG